MQDRDENESSIIAKSIDELALAEAIKQNLFDTDNAPGERRLANIRNGHIIERYTDPSRTQRVKRNYNNGRERKIADKKRNRSSGNPLRHQQSDTPALNSGVLHQPHNDLTWLDDPQTLYLKRKLHVHDSLTFVDNLARILSSSCVLDAMKKVKLMYDVVASAGTVTYPVFAIDCDGKVIAWNNAMEQLTGIPAYEMIGKGNYAYSVPFYGTARPMLIDYLILPDPGTDNYVRSHLTDSGEIRSSKAETIWLHGKPKVIWGRGTRIHDEKGTIVGAVQSIGIQDPVPGLTQYESAKPESESSPSGSSFLKSPPIPAEVSSPGAPADIPDRAWNDLGLPAGEIQDQKSRGRHSSDRQEDLRSVLRQLMTKEDDLVRNTGTRSQDPPLTGVEGSNTADVLFEHVVMEAREGIIAYDTSLRCILWNAFMEQLTGIPAAGVLGKQAFDMFPALKDAGAYLLLEQALSGKTVESSDISCHIPVTGKQAWLRLIFSSLRDNKGSVIGIIGIVQDTTARKVMEYALQTTIMQLMESEEKYRSVFNAKNDPLLLIDATNRGILDLNNAAADLYGYSREDFFTLSPSDLFTEPEKYNHLLERQSPGTCICRHRKKDGTVFPADISYAYVELKGHQALILSIRDLSTAYQTADALRLANTKLNLLIGITRHDVINNLTVLMGYNDLLKHTVTEPKILAWLEKEDSALKAVHRQIEFTREYYNLGVKSPLWQNICETSTRAYSQFITTLAFTCDTRDLEIYADPLLEKVFYNLFDNAIRHGESVTQIRMYCTREGPDLLLIFGDDGEGIVPENKERIFTRGFGKHTGLGLFLTREILAITRIEITENGEFGKGARFELRIPAGSYRFPDSGNPIKMSGTEQMNQHA